jgi:hypothetical protein
MGSFGGPGHALSGCSMLLAQSNQLFNHRLINMLLTYCQTCICRTQPVNPRPTFSESRNHPTRLVQRWGTAQRYSFDGEY